MKNPAKLLTLLVLAAAPAALFAASSTDRQIDDAAKASYNFRTVLNNEVSVDTKDGVVTLTGTVNDRDQRSLAEDTVNNLPGVVSVNNEIKVESEPAEHSDGWIALKIRGQLLVHANVSATATKVDVNAGVVTLTGTVDNSAQKDLTEAYVKDISGVKSVNNQLVVNDNSRDGRDHPVAESIDDASITTEVKSALLFHRSTSVLKTKVTTTNGVVMIGGEATSDAEKDLVSKLAGSVRGVKSVDNDMTVRAN
jgi:osmotically-inducible protein OsmY